ASAPNCAHDKGLCHQTSYDSLQLCAHNRKGKALALLLESPRYKTRRFDDVPYLDASAAYDGGTLVINVVNRHRDQAIETVFETQDKQFSGAVDVAEVNGPDIKSEHAFDTTNVRTIQRTTKADGRQLRHSFPPHSYTILKAKLASRTPS